jgi:HD superfamily phosphohydrolase
MEVPSKPLEAWKNLRYMDNGKGKKEWVFTDPEQIYALTMFRAHMYKMVYQAPVSRAREALMAHVFRQLHQEGFIDPKDFLRFDDTRMEWNLELVMWLRGMSEVWRDITWISRIGIEEQFEWRDYNTSESRLKWLKTLFEEDSDMIVQFQKGTRAATGTKVLRNGKVMTLREAYPIQAREIEKMMDELTYIGVYRYGGEPTFDVSNEELEWMFNTITEKREQHLDDERWRNEPNIPGLSSEVCFLGLKR